VYTHLYLCVLCVCVCVHLMRCATHIHLLCLGDTALVVTDGECIPHFKQHVWGVGHDGERMCIICFRAVRWSLPEVKVRVGASCDPAFNTDPQNLTGNAVTCRYPHTPTSQLGVSPATATTNLPSPPHRPPTARRAAQRKQPRVGPKLATEVVTNLQPIRGASRILRHLSIT